MSINRRNVKSFCRICLTKLEKSDGHKYHIHKTQDLNKWITICTSLEIKEDDGYPKFLCQQCYDKVESLYDFRSMSVRSMQILDEIMQNTTQELISTECDSENEDTKEDSKEFVEENRTVNNDSVVKDILWNQEVYISSCETLDDNTNLVNRLVDEDLTSTNVKIKEDYCDAVVTKSEVPFDSDAENKTDDDSNDEEFQTLDSESESFQEKSIVVMSKPRKRSKFNCSRKRLRSSSSSELVECTKVSSVNAIERKTQVLKCEKCPKRCFSQANFEAHMRTHEGLKPYPCKQCNRSYNKSSHLNAHIKDSHTELTEEFVCNTEGCNKKFRRLQSYRVHYRLKHAQNKPSPKIYVCEDCGRTFKNITTLKEHRYKHTNEEEYPYQCEHCMKRFVSQRTYREHLMRHAGIKNFVCTYCGMKKTTKSELRIHINYHTKEKQWPCPLCPSVFNSSANLGLHDRVVHKGIRRYVCRFCEQSFGKAETLKHHEMRHTGEKPHECDTCGKRFIQVVALRAHLKTHKSRTDENEVTEASSTIPATPSLAIE